MNQLSITLTVDLERYSQIDQSVLLLVPLPHFEARAHEIRLLAQSNTVFFAPLLENDVQAGQWQNFSITEAPRWLQSSIEEIQSVEPNNVDLYSLLETLLDGSFKMLGPNGDTVLPRTYSADRNTLPVLHYSPPVAQNAMYQDLDLYSDEDFHRAA